MSRPLSGLSAWLVQRLSAAYMLLFTLAALLLLAVADLGSYDAWRALWGAPAVAAAAAIFFIALLAHAWVGVRDVVLDYAGRSTALRLALLGALGGWLLVLALWVLRILMMATGS